MDCLQHQNPSSRSHSSFLKPPRPPRGPAFQHPSASRPLPEPSSPDGRPRKKVRFASEAVHPRLRVWSRWVSDLGNSAKLSVDIRD